MTTGVKISVDGGGDQRREVAGDQRTIRGPEVAEQDTRKRTGFGGISKIWPVGNYILALSVWPSGTTRWHRDAEPQAVATTRWDRRDLIGCTKIENLINPVNSVWPKWMNRSDRNTQRGFGSLSLWQIGDSECSSHRVVRIWLDQILWCSMNRVWDEKSIDS